MMDELMEADEYFGEEDEWVEDSFEDSWMELEKARGEKVIKMPVKLSAELMKKNPNKTAHHDY